MIEHAGEGAFPAAPARAAHGELEQHRRHGDADKDVSIDSETLVALRLPADLRYVCIRKSKASNPPISVVMPVHNRAQVLLQAIDSVLKIDDCNFELVIVDDGSTDRTVDILKNVNDPRISVISLESNLGANTARNAGIALARAPVIAFLDSDDLYFSGRLSEPLYILGQNPDVGVVISSFATRKGQKSGAVQLSEAIYGGDELLHLTARYILPPSTSGLTVRRESLLACQGFDPFVRRMQDRDLLMRLTRFTKGASSARVLWEKNWSRDGISSQLNTQYDALSSFIALHPIYNSQELDTRNYMIGRHIIALLKARQWRRGAEVYRHARRALSPKLPILPLLWWGYVKTRLARKQTKARVNAKRDIATG